MELNNWSATEWQTGVIHLTDVNQVLAGMDTLTGGTHPRGEKEGERSETGSSGCSTFPTGFQSALLSRRVPTRDYGKMHPFALDFRGDLN